FGYGRIDAYKSVRAAALGQIPPEAGITSPEWFEQINPSLASFAVNGYVSARTSYTCHVDIAPGAEPNNASRASGGDFATLPSSFCDGTTKHSGSHSGLLASVSTATLASLFPHGDPSSFAGNENGGLAQTSNGRPNTLPYAFTVRVVVTGSAAGASPAMTGEDRRQMF